MKTNKCNYVLIVLLSISTLILISCGRKESPKGTPKGTPKQISQESPKAIEIRKAQAALLNTKYSRIDDYERWIPVLYQQKDFASIERQVLDLLSDRNDEAKAYQLYVLYNTLADVEHGDIKEIELSKNVLDEWCSKQPMSHIPWLVRGSFYTDYAWQIRGGGWAENVPKDAWPKFRGKLEQAQADLEKSYQLNPDDPNSSSSLLIVARGLSQPKEKMEEHFKNATLACLFHFGAHYQKLNYLMPKWHGTPEEMYDFSTQCMKFADQHPYMGLVMVAALEEVHKRSSKEDNYLGRDDVWPTVEKIYHNFFAKYPEDIRRRFYYAYHAYQAKKYDVAIRQFEIIGDRWMEGTAWRSLERYHNSRAHAYATYAVTLPSDRAVINLKRSIDLDPSQRTSYFNLGTFATKLGQYEEAEAAFLKAIEFNPNDAETHLRLSWIYGKIKNPVKSKEYAEKALRCNPTEQQKQTAKNYIDFCNKTLK